MTTQRVLTLGNYTCWLPGWVGPTYSSASGQKLARSWVLRLKASTLCVRRPWIVLVKQQHGMFPLSLVTHHHQPTPSQLWDYLRNGHCSCFLMWPPQLHPEILATFPFVRGCSWIAVKWLHNLWKVLTHWSTLHSCPVHIPALFSRICIIRSM